MNVDHLQKKRIFTDDECDFILSVADNYFTPLNSGIGTDRYTMEAPEFQWVRDKFATALGDPEQTYAPYLIRYFKGHIVHKHIDFWPEVGEGEGIAGNTLICHKEDFEGGDFYCYKDGIREKADMQRGLMYAYDLRLPHEVTRMISGVRINMISRIKTDV